ncbi:rod-binding protein [Caldicellulosiruptoraceae bacterium PP1]
MNNINAVGSNLSNFDTSILEKAYNEKDKEKLKDLCNQFESLLLSQVFKEMRQSIPKSDLIKTGIADDIFNEMFIDEVSQKSSEQGGIGLSKMLYDAMVRRLDNQYKIK